MSDFSNKTREETEAAFLRGDTVVVESTTFRFWMWDKQIGKIDGMCEMETCHDEYETFDKWWDEHKDSKLKFL